MSENDNKDIMGDIINDISSAADEAVEEVEDKAEEVQETAEEMQETAEDVASLDDALEGLRLAAEEAQEQAEAHTAAETIIVKFDDDLEAAQAVRIINKALRKRNDTIYQGAFVKRAGDDKLEVEDFSKMGLADLVTGTAAIGLDLGKDGMKLAWTTAAAGIGFITGGIRLLRRTAVSAAGLGGSTMTLRRRHKLDTFESEEAVAVSTTNLSPGETAVVIVADRETANELATDLVRRGGELA